MKRAFIVHGWSGSPDGNDWIPWAKKQLEAKGYQAQALSMPDKDHPKIETWVPYLAKVVGELQETDILIGHSMGCQTILRYLEGLPGDKKVSKVILVAGFISLMGLTEDEWVVAKPWVDAPLDLEKVKQHANSFIAIFSDNDPYVPLEENKQVFEEKLGAKVIVEANKGHFAEDDGIRKLPVLLELI